VELRGSDQIRLHSLLIKFNLTSVKHFFTCLTSNRIQFIGGAWTIKIPQQDLKVEIFTAAALSVPNFVRLWYVLSGTLAAKLKISILAKYPSIQSETSAPRNP
jgi:hypothetical protein